MERVNEKESRDMEACGWDDEFWEEIGLGDLIDGHHAKIGMLVSFLFNTQFLYFVELQNNPC